MQLFPKEFVQSLESIIGGESRQLLDALQTDPQVSIRFNPYKIGDKPEGEGVPWCRYGFYLDQRPQFTLDPFFHGGIYYVQEAGSMFVEHLFRESIGTDIDGIKILDLCAAPGGKTTLLSSVAGLEGLVVSNEVIRQRANVLSDNVRKWGLGNVVVTNNDPSHFKAIEHWFDAIVVDAPCSGEGMFRKNIDAVSEWSPENVALCAARQRRILSDAWGSLKPGGVLIYSTCTFNRTENEDNLLWLQEQFDCEHVGINVPDSWGIVKGVAGEIETFRFYPHRVKSEGFFAAILRKGAKKIKLKLPKPRKMIFNDLPKASRMVAAEWFAQPEYMRLAAIGDDIYGYYQSQFHNVKIVAESLTAIYSGVMAGAIFKGKLRPEHPLALFHDLARNNAPEINLTKEQAIDYLRKSELDASCFEEGINLVCYENAPIGWAKRIGNRVNNNYPTEIRIKNS